MKWFNLFTALTIVLIVGCSDSILNTFNETFKAYLAQEVSLRDYADSESVNNEDNSSGVYKSGNTLVSPLEEVVTNTSVLNQGVTNSSVTLSSLGAIGILIHQDSERYSPFCSLNLGNFLQYQDRYKSYNSLNDVITRNNLQHYPSGWKGSTQSILFEQIKKFGLQASYSFCGYDYFDSNEHINEINPDEYTNSSYFIDKDIEFKVECSNYDNSAADCQYLDPNQAEITQTIISSIKANIDSKALSVVSTILFSNLKNYGVKKSYYRFEQNKNTPNVWDYTTNIDLCRSGAQTCSIVTHEMIVFGYIDNPLNEEQGLLVLRNSWGSESGDSGNYYMSYTYAKNMIVSLYHISNK